jgi:hypothetical protein
MGRLRGLASSALYALSPEPRLARTTWQSLCPRSTRRQALLSCFAPPPYPPPLPRSLARSLSTAHPPPLRLTHCTTIADVSEIGRFNALLLGLYVIATGAGTVHGCLAPRHCLVLVLIMPLFIVMQILGQPLTLGRAPIENDLAFVASVGFYLVLLFATLAEARLNQKVLKAQLLMIRAQGVRPSTTPAFRKFQLFRRLPLFALGYFFLHTLRVATRSWGTMDLGGWFAVTVVWEMTQLVVTLCVGWLFSTGSFNNPLLTTEPHLPSDQVRETITAQEVDVAWGDTSTIDRGVSPASSIGAASSPTPLLRPWDRSLAVPAPPPTPGVLEVFRIGGGRNRRGPAPIQRPIGVMVPAARAAASTASCSSSVSLYSDVEMPQCSTASSTRTAEVGQGSSHAPLHADRVITHACAASASALDTHELHPAACASHMDDQMVDVKL